MSQLCWVVFSMTSCLTVDHDLVVVRKLTCERRGWGCATVAQPQPKELELFYSPDDFLRS